MKHHSKLFLACRLIPLDKNPGLRPIGVGEVLRRIAGKVVMKVVKEDIKKAVGCLQLCAGQEAGCEAAIHAMHGLFESNETEAILMVDVENTFNSINHKALLHNIDYLCPVNCNAYLQLLCDICSSLYYWWKRIKIARRNNTGGPNSDGSVCLRFNSIT